MIENLNFGFGVVRFLGDLGTGFGGGIVGEGLDVCVMEGLSVGVVGKVGLREVE